MMLIMATMYSVTRSTHVTRTNYSFAKILVRTVLQYTQDECFLTQHWHLSKYVTSLLYKTRQYKRKNVQIVGGDNWGRGWG